MIKQANMPRSSTNTPAPGYISGIPGEYEWVKEWVTPENLKYDGKPVKLKKWTKVPASSSYRPGFTLSEKDHLDLKSMKYYDEVPIVDHSIKREPVESDDNDPATKDELQSALSMEVKDDQVSSLSGIA